MAVPPANGAIYLSKIALEKAYDNYNHSSSWTTLEPNNNKISLKQEAAFEMFGKAGRPRSCSNFK